MKNNLFLYSLLIFTVIFMAGCATGIPQLPINNNLQGNESDQGNNQDGSTGVPRVVFIELFNTEYCAASKAINPIIEEIVAEYENTEVILVEMAGWGKHATDETYERFKWYFPDKSKLHTPSVCFDGLNQLFAEGFSLGASGNSVNVVTGNTEDTEDNEKPVTGEVDTTNSDPVIPNMETPVIADTEETETGSLQKWSGLGITLFSTNNNEWVLSLSFEKQVDDLLANGFTQLRIDLVYWADAGVVEISKSAVAIAVAKGADVIWGVGAEATTLTSSNWASYRQGILDAATWAQANGVYEFQLGNEEEHHNDDKTLTDAQLITNLKDVATDVQEIFTNGNVSYSCYYSNISDWVTAGRGDIDIIASNLYMNGDWKTLTKVLVAGFGVDHTYLTEFGLSGVSLDDYSTDEAIQAADIAEMIDYIKDSGIKRAIYFNYYDDSRPFGPEGFGVLKDDGNYRSLWSQSLLNSESLKFATVPTKTTTTTVSLPNTIALLAE